MKKVLLMILDGWGIGQNNNSNAIFLSKTPNVSELLKKYPHSQLLASGNAVGLPEGIMGNSEVGHLSIGSGRVLYQDLVKINLACKDDSIYKNPKIVEAFSYAKENSKAIHLIGLVSDGGVHSMDTHIYKLCDVAKEYNIENLFIHAITDGRDTDPKSGLGYISRLTEHLKTSNGQIASLIGRYYAMDRDKRWERIKEAYDLYTAGTGEKSEDVLKSIQTSYDNGITDEFIKPTIIIKNEQPIGLIKEGDVVICVNYRTDRLRELTIALTQERFPEYDMTPIPLKYYTMTRYDDSFKDVNVIYDKENLINTLGEVVSKNNLKQLRIAETEKYAHVTFFFSGGREKEFEGERRVLIPSPKVATYDLRPEMSAIEVKEAVIAEIKKQDLSFICINFANADMVGHTGVLSAIEKAVETVDTCAGEVIKTATENGFDILIIADHGNADFVINDDGTPNTAHTINPVPCILVSNNYQEIKNGTLADVAPTILDIMGLNIPPEMTGKSLVK